MTFASDEKLRPFNCFFFQSREQAVVRWGHIRRIGWVIKTLEGKTPWWPSRGVFSLKMSFNCTSRDEVILRVDSLALWKIINEEDAVLIPKNRGRRELFQRIFVLGFFLGGGVNCYASTPLIVALFPGHNYITRYCPWSPIAPDRKSCGSRRKNSKLAQKNGIVDAFDPRSGISGPTSRRASACPNLHEWWTQPAHVRCPVAQLFI